MEWDELRGKCTLKTGLENSDYPCPSLPKFKTTIKQNKTKLHSVGSTFQVLLWRMTNNQESEYFSCTKLLILEEVL